MKKFLISIFILFSVVSFGFSHSFEAAVELTHYIQKNYCPKASLKEDINVVLIDGNKTPGGGRASFVREDNNYRIEYTESVLSLSSAYVLIYVIHELSHFETCCMNHPVGHDNTFYTIHLAIYMKVLEDIREGELDDLLFIKESNFNFSWNGMEGFIYKELKVDHKGKEPKYSKKLYNKVYNFKKED